MLQLNSQATQAALTQNSDGRIGGSVREAAKLPAVISAELLSSAGTTSDFVVLQAAALEPLVAQDLVEHEASEAAVDVEQAPQPTASVAAQPEAIAEQWLLGMLGQRAAQVEARDGESVRALDDSQAVVPTSAAQWYASARAALPMVALSGAREATQSPLAEVAGTLLAQAPVNPANPLSEAAALQRAAPEPLASQLLGQLDGLSVQAAAVDVGKAAANQAKILSEVVAPKVASPEALDGQLLAQLGQTTTPAEVGTASVGPSQATQVAGLERTLKLQAPQVKWGEQMLHALRESVELQLQQRVQHTTIRLDPPELGSLEIFLSHESGRLSVQISAAQGDVARLLQQTSERLRHELVGQNFMQVSVQVSADGQPGQPHERQAHARLFDEEPLMAASHAAEQPELGPASRSGDVLITV